MATRFFERKALLTLLIRLGVKAGVQDCHPYRLRHTFAAHFLSQRKASHRNGDNAFELQTACPAFPGIVQTYLALAHAYLGTAHRNAWPDEDGHRVLLRSGDLSDHTSSTGKSL
jgi:integrase